jgi:hypothetical protein
MRLICCAFSALSEKARVFLWGSWRYARRCQRLLALVFAGGHVVQVGGGEGAQGRLMVAPPTGQGGEVGGQVDRRLDAGAQQQDGTTSGLGRSG